MNFLVRFKEIRVQKGLTQKEYADVLGVKQKTVSNWESGRNEPNMGILTSLSTIWAINIDWLLTGKGEMYLKESVSVATSNHIVSGNNNIVGNGNGNININTEKFNHKEDIKDIIELLEYAPAGFLTIIKSKLIAFREMSHF